jgi:hypothetical protein
MTITDQIVVRYPDSTYTVRTYEVDGPRRILISEVPANTRSIVQATIAGRVAYAEES